MSSSVHKTTDFKSQDGHLSHVSLQIPRFRNHWSRYDMDHLVDNKIVGTCCIYNLTI